MKKIISIKKMVVLGLVAASMQVTAQGLTPLIKEGSTNGNKKVFTVALMNPYNQKMRYEMQAFDKQTGEEQPDIKFSGRKGVITRYGQKKLRVYIPVHGEDRSSRICVTFPEMQGTIRPRVCGDFTVFANNR